MISLKILRKSTKNGKRYVFARFHLFREIFGLNFSPANIKILAEIFGAEVDCDELIVLGRNFSDVSY